MSRLKRFTHALVSGYVLLAANVAFTLGSVPLALKYLPNSVFGLWALTVQVMGFIGLLDLGMTGAFARLLIDHKDDRGTGNYGALIRTGFLVGMAQGLIVLGLGAVAALGLAPWLDIQAGLEREYLWLTLGQAGLLAGSFLSRPLMNVLVAHQRQDVANLVQTASFGLNYGVMWFCFIQGAGVFSLLWGQLAGWGFTAVALGVGVVRLGMLPRRGEWGRASWGQFLEMFAFGKDVFLFSVGYQLIYTSQTILVTRALGLEMGALWTVGTRAFSLGTQVICRVFDMSCAALAEMIVREERQRLFARFRSIVVVTTSLGVWGAVLLAVCNASFVETWTGGRFQWPVVRDLLLGAWLLINVLGRAHVGLVGQTKDFGFLRWVYFFEGVLFVGLAGATLRVGGLTVMLVCSLVANGTCSLPYGLWRTRRYFGLGWREILWDWSRPAFLLALWLIPLAGLLGWLSAPWPAGWRFGFCAAVLSVAGGILLCRVGIEPRMQEEVRRRVPLRLRAAVTWWLGRGSVRPPDLE